MEQQADVEASRQGGQLQVLDPSCSTGRCGNAKSTVKYLYLSALLRSAPQHFLTALQAAVRAATVIFDSCLPALKGSIMSKTPSSSNARYKWLHAHCWALIHVCMHMQMFRAGARIPEGAIMHGGGSAAGTISGRS